MVDEYPKNYGNVHIFFEIYAMSGVWIGGFTWFPASLPVPQNMAAKWGSSERSVPAVSQSPLMSYDDKAME